VLPLDEDAVVRPVDRSVREPLKLELVWCVELALPGALERQRGEPVDQSA